MIKSIGKLSLVTILAALVLGVPVHASAQDKTNTTATAPVKARPLPFRGKVGSIDKTAKTITLDESTKRTFIVNSETKITKDNKPGTLSDAVVGEAVSGSYTKGDDGKLTAKSLRFGARPATAPAPAPTTPKP